MVRSLTYLTAGLLWILPNGFMLLASGAAWLTYLILTASYNTLALLFFGSLVLLTFVL